MAIKLFEQRFYINIFKLAAAGVVIITAIGGAFAAVKRGRLLNGKEAGFVDNLKEGLKSIFTAEGREKYKKLLTRKTPTGAETPAKPAKKPDKPQKPAPAASKEALEALKPEYLKEIADDTLSVIASKAFSSEHTPGRIKQLETLFTPERIRKIESDGRLHTEFMNWLRFGDLTDDPFFLNALGISM